MTTATLATEIPVAAIHTSTTNPRKRFDPEGLAELADSVRQHGVLQAILVRPRPSVVGEPDAFELVAGERRLRAAREAELETIPATVRELTDREVLEIQIAENLQRKDLHPLEEAEGYRLLHEEHGISVDDLAHRIGKSRRYVYQRLQIGRLDSQVRDLLLEDRLSVSVALLVAQLPADLQLEAGRLAAGLDPKSGKPAFEWEWEGGKQTKTAADPLTFREAVNLIRREFATALQSATWKLDDATLLPAAGACSECPKRTGAQAELFGKFAGRADACTDRGCFAAKKAAALAAALDRERQLGREVLEGKPAAKLLTAASARKADVVNLEHRADGDPRWRTWGKLLGKKAAELKATAAVNARGEIEVLVPRSAALEILRSKYEWARTPARKASSTVSGATKRAQEKRRQALEIRRRTVAAFLEAAGDYATADIWKVVAAAAIREVWADTLKAVLRRREIVVPRGSGSETPARELLAGMDAREARLFALELLVSSAVVVPGGTDEPLDLACELLEVDVKAIEKAVAAEASAAAKPAKKKASKKPRGKAAGKKKTSQSAKAEAKAKKARSCRRPSGKKAAQ